MKLRDSRRCGDSEEATDLARLQGIMPAQQNFEAIHT